MLLSDINSAGEGAADSIKDILTIKEMASRYGISYDAEIQALRAFYNDATLVYATMTDEQVLEYLLHGIGDAEAVALAKSAKVEKEKCVLQVKSSADKFINNI